MDVVIPKNEPIPCSRTRFYGTRADDQTVIKLRVIQGLSDRARDCHKLIDIELTGINPGPSTTEKVSVTFSIDINGILSITAQDSGT